MKFTEPQQRAISHVEGNLQLIACAGSGKTEVVARRVVTLLTSAKQGGGGCTPANIVAFTFTDKAAAELKERIHERCHEKFGEVIGLADMYIGTIHAWSASTSTPIPTPSELGGVPKQPTEPRSWQASGVSTGYWRGLSQVCVTLLESLLTRTRDTALARRRSHVRRQMPSASHGLARLREAARYSMRVRVRLLAFHLSRRRRSSSAAGTSMGRMVVMRSSVRTTSRRPTRCPKASAVHLIGHASTRRTRAASSASPIHGHHCRTCRVMLRAGSPFSRPACWARMKASSRPASSSGSYRRRTSLDRGRARQGGRRLNAARPDLDGRRGSQGR